jgi:hypothetical protein
VAPFSSTLPALSPAIQRLILHSLLIDTTLDSVAFYARFNGWVNGPAGRAWRLETGAERSADGPGRPFYPQAIAVPPSVATAADRQLIDEAWQQRLAEADRQFGAGPSVDKTQSLRQCDNRLLQPLNLMGRASFGDVRLAYLWPSRRADRVVSGVSVLRRLIPTFEALFRAVYELGWNDLLFETMGAGCFRGIKHPSGSGTYQSAARRLSDHGYGIAIDVNYQEHVFVKGLATDPFMNVAGDTGTRSGWLPIADGFATDAPLGAAALGNRAFVFARRASDGQLAMRSTL